MFAPRVRAPVPRLVLALLAIPGVLSMTEPSCEVKEYCPGHEPETFGAGNTVQAILADLRNTFCGCKRIGGSVNVFFPPMSADNYSLVEDDFNFLFHLEEVGGGVTFINVPPIDTLTLPRLVLIRGNNLPSHSLAPNGFALTLVNSTVDKFVLPALVEITVGSMQLYNSTWCGYYTVNWEDIFEAGSVHLLPDTAELNFTAALEMSCPSEDRGCSGCTSRWCWVPNDNTTCQTLSKTVCPPFCPERCSELDGVPFCCNTRCAAGCIGGITESHCVACEKFNNNGTCVDICPPRFIYDIMEQRLVFNPDGRVAAGDQCLEECPRGLFELSGSCVVSCPENHMVDNNVCVSCGGPCPQGTECQGWSGADAVQNDDILEEFLNNECVIVNGHIRFNSLTTECRNQDPAQFCDRSSYLSEETLQRFQFVKVIRGQLLISGWNLSMFPSLPSVIDYFRNVESIGSLNLTLDTVNTEGDALVISTNPGLQGVDLSRLRSVHFGNVRVRNNPELCYVGDFQTTTSNNSVYLTETQLILPTGPTNFMSVEDCNADNMTCHVECEQERRCWGPDDTNCVACVNYRYPPLWRCVPNCEEYNETFPNNDTKECEQCHEECLGCCNSGPFQCKACRNLRIVHDAAGDGIACHNGTECVATCPGNYYEDGSDCKLCHELCVGGCTGPGNFVGDEGCEACDFVNFYQNDTQISCVAQCPASTYRHQLEQAIGPVPASNGACHPCHDLCDTCFGPLNTECFTCKYATLENTTGNATVSTCIAECPFDHYKAASKVCRPCHEQCDGCTGQGNKMCLRCKNVRVVVPQTQPPTTYECLASCPNSSYWIDHDDNDTCIPCHYLCATCVGSNNSECTQCKAIQAIPIDLNRTIIVNNVSRTLYTCEATLGLSGSGSPSVNLPWWGSLMLGVGLPLVLLLLLVLGVYLLCRVWRNRLKDVSYESKAPIVDNPVYGTWDELVIEMEMLPQPKVPPNLSKITIIPQDSLKLEDKLGSGAFGIVYKGYWTPEGEEFEYTVAVKVLNENTGAEATSELLDEGVAMASMDHPYVVRLFGISMGRQMMLVSQFVPLGSLLEFLRKHKERLNAKNMLTFAHQIAEGMGYLEQQRMVHRDLAARNVLVQSANNVKITDFGLSKCLDVGEAGYKGGQGKVPVRWLAPECLKNREYSHKSDVWAFGVTVWEILTFGARPYKNTKPQEMYKYLESGQRLAQPPTCTIDLYKVLLKCWLLDPAQRPDFNKLAVQFDSMCLDPLRYLSTLVDGQMEDYTALPCNDATEVDKHVYETPMDEGRYAMAFSDVGEYDNPDEAVAYLNPVPSVKANRGASTEELVATIDEHAVGNSYNYIVDTGVEESVKANEYTCIDDVEVDGTADGVKANEYAYIDDQEVDGTKEDANEYNYIDDAVADTNGQEPQLSRMDEYDEYPEWNTVGFSPLANEGNPFV